MGVLIRNGTVVTALDRWVGDVYCHEGRIAALGPGLAAGPGDEVIDASGQLVLPGGVDPHVHLELAVAGTVSADDFESGTAAALAGGTTTVLDFVHPERGQDYLEALAERQSAARKAAADYGLHMAVTWWGPGVGEAIARCAREAGVPSFKAYMAYKASVGLDDDDLLRAMTAVARADGLLLLHAEHGDLVEHLRDELAAAGAGGDPRCHARSRPPEAEGEAVARAALLARHAGVTIYVVHVTCREAVAALAAARAGGQAVHGETCPQYLLLAESAYDRPGFEGASYVISPPLRPAAHQQVLWNALGAGILEVVATDHCPFTMAQKLAGRDDFRLIPGGAAGVEHRLALLHTHGVCAGRLSLERWVDLVSTRPAKLFGLYPRKGSITLGADADLVVWDPEARATISAATHHHRSDRSIYEGFVLHGQPSWVLLRGRPVVARGDLRAERGAGRFLHRRPWPHLQPSTGADT